MTKDEHLSDPKGGVTLRAVLVGAVLCACLGAGEQWGVLIIHGSALCADFSTGGAIFLFFVLVFVLNGILRLTSRELAFSRTELITVYAMMIVAAAIPSWGFVMNLLPLLAGVFYYATPENQWADHLHGSLNEWLVPTDEFAIRKFFEGLSHGERLPLTPWLKPFLLWGSFIIAAYFAMMCIMTIMRKQWVERERLLYPLTQLPLDMTQEGDEAIPFWRNRLMWIGFALPVILNSINALHSYIPVVPQIHPRFWFFMLGRSQWVVLEPRYEVIGLAFLLSLDVSLSLWLFSFLALWQQAIFRYLGWSLGRPEPYGDPGIPAVSNQALGAMIVLVLSGLWFGRRHIWNVLRKAFANAGDVDDGDEAVSYRTAVFGAIAGTLYVAIVLKFSGLTVPQVAIFLFASFIVLVALTRIVAQCGLAYGRAPVIPASFTLHTVGSRSLGRSGMTALALSFSWIADVRTIVMTSTANSLKLADSVKVNKRRLFWALQVAIVVCLISSAWGALYLGYRHGGINLSSWQFGWLSSYTYNWATNALKTGVEVTSTDFIFIGIGALAMITVTFLQHLFFWWPLHPIGLAIGLTHPVFHTWFSVFLAWLLKLVIVKLGGIKLYRRARPFFLGMVLGVFTSAGVWLVIDYFAGGMWNRFTLG